MMCPSQLLSCFKMEPAPGGGAPVSALSDGLGTHSAAPLFAPRAPLPPDLHAWCRVPAPGRVSGAVAASGRGSAAGARACALQPARPSLRRAGARPDAGPGAPTDGSSQLSVFSLVSRAAAGG